MAIDANPLKRIVDQPREGWFKLRLVKKGPYVSARIGKDEEGRWVATINDEVQSPPNEDPIKAAGVLRIWHSAQVVPEHEYEYLVQRRRWAMQNDPTDPLVDPGKPIDLLTRPLVY